MRTANFNHADGKPGIWPWYYSQGQTTDLRKRVNAKVKLKIQFCKYCRKIYCGISIFTNGYLFFFGIKTTSGKKLISFLKNGGNSIAFLKIELKENL